MVIATYCINGWGGGGLIVIIIQKIKYIFKPEIEKTKFMRNEK